MTTPAKGISNRQIRASVNKQADVIEAVIMDQQQVHDTIKALADNQRILADAMKAFTAQTDTVWKRLRWIAQGRS